MSPNKIKAAVEEAYGVSVDSVRTMIYAGKTKSRFTKAGVISGRTNHIKKAIVQLSEGGRSFLFFWTFVVLSNKTTNSSKTSPLQKATLLRPFLDWQQPGTCPA